MNQFQVSVLSPEPSRELTVLRIASAATNSVTQLYDERPQVSLPQLEDLNRKILRKLGLHQIRDVQCSVSLQFANDRTVTLTSFDALREVDFEVDVQTQSAAIKWSFVMRSSDADPEHLHSIYVRISERPNPGILLQRMFSSQSDDMDTPDVNSLSAIAAKLDFVDSRFSSEVFSVLSDWVRAQARAEPTFPLAKLLLLKSQSITSFVTGTLPAVCVLAYVGIWLSSLSEATTSSVRLAAAWILGGGCLFLLGRYVAQALASLFQRHIHRIWNVPLFQLTAGDKNRMTKYLARSHSSFIKLCAAGIAYGAFKAVGLYLASLILRSL